MIRQPPATPQTKLPANQPRRADDGPGGGLCPLCKGFYSVIHGCWKWSPVTTPRPERSTHTVLKGYSRRMARSLAGLASYTRHFCSGPGWSEVLFPIAPSTPTVSGKVSGWCSAAGKTNDQNSGKKSLEVFFWQIPMVWREVLHSENDHVYS